MGPLKLKLCILIGEMCVVYGYLAYDRHLCGSHIRAVGINALSLPGSASIARTKAMGPDAEMGQTISCHARHNPFGNSLYGFLGRLD